MTPQELKNSILQLAIQGKLVEQRPEEGTAEDLYYQLKAEKASGIKKGLWGKSKSLTEIEDGEILFEIPDSWRWIKIGEIASVVTKGTTPRGGNVSYLDEGIGFLRAENVAGLDKIDKTNLKCIDIDTHTGFLKRSIIEANDILITIAGTLGRTALVRETDLPLNANQAVSIVRLVNTKDLSLLFLIYALNSAAIQRYLTGQKKITAIPNLTLEIIENCLIPLPPLAEQKRIVAKIEELLPLIDRYDQAWTKLEDFNKRFPGDMQKSILQMAIQGKLVPQDASEGTGKELFKQIQMEKVTLTANGKKIKWKTQAELKDDELPFDIPNSWKWVRLGDIVSIESGKGLTSSQMRKGSIPVYGGNGITGYHNESLLHKETVVIGRVGFYCGSVHITESEAWVTDNAFITTYPERSIDRKYLVYMLRHMNLGQNNNATAQPVVSGKKIYPLPFPIPPLAEQKRIVAKLDELLPMCERLKS